MISAMTSFEFELPAVQGIQAGRPYYLTACPLRLLSRLFPENDDVSPSGRQPHPALNRARIPEIARYVTGNPRSYVFGALTASVDAAVAFDSSEKDASVCSGKVRIPMSAKLVLHDGQHRCAGLKAAVRDDPKLGDETIAIVLFVDPGFRRSEQMFTDLKRHERRLPRSLSILHDDRDEYARLARQVIRKVEVFGDNVEMVRTTISNRSRKLFTLSAIYQATKTLVAEQTEVPVSGETANRNIILERSRQPDSRVAAGDCRAGQSCGTPQAIRSRPRNRPGRDGPRGAKPSRRQSQKLAGQTGWP